MDILTPAAKGKRSLIQILEAWADTRPDKIHVSVPLSIDVSEGFRDVTHREIRDAADTFAWWLVETYGRSETFDTIAFVGVSDLRYPVVFFGAIKAGYKSLFVSPRNNTTTNISLLEQTQCRHLLFAPEMAALAESVKAQMPAIHTAQVAPFDHWLQSYEKPFPFEKSFEESKWDPILILHSSGSTGMPKPVTLPNGFFAATDAPMRPIAGRSLSGTAAFSFDGGGFYFSPFPPFHLAGANALIYQPLIALEASAIIGLPDRPPTPQFVLDIIKHKKPRALYSPPSLIEMMSHIPGGMDTLKSCECIIYAGGPLSKTCGDQLAHHVRLSTVYGSTETGNNHMLMPRPEDWDYLEFHPDFFPQMDPAVDGASELVFSQDEPNKVVRGITWSYPQLGSYRTRDMFMPHPSKTGLWKFYGRNDDIIVFSNGAKYNPVPAEDAIASSDKVTGVLIIGVGRTQAAALIEPKADPSSVEQFIDELWPFIERSNKNTLKQGHLTRSHVAVVSVGGLVRAAKGTVVRSLTCDKFRDIIEQLYSGGNADTSLSRGPQLAAPYDLGAAMLAFVRECAHCINGLSGIGDTEDFYVRGLDSILTLELVRLMKSGLKPQHGDVSWLTGQLVFEHPTIKKLASALEKRITSRSSSGSHHVKEIGKVSVEDHILTTITKYSQNFPQTGQLVDDASLADHTRIGLNVVLTGSTGSLGLRILQNLIKDSGIASVICLDRSNDARFRVEAAIGPSDTTNVRYLQARFGEAHLGLSDDAYAELKDSAHVIIHCAWKVDFNQSLESFEPVHVRGVANLIDFSYGSTKHPRIVFVSSTSSVGSWRELHDSERPVPEAVVRQPSAAARMGYGQSKFVSECILANATHSSAGKVSVTILRIGQVAGPVDDTAVGPIWNSSEWFPSLLKTSKALHCIPKDLSDVDWIPVDRLGSAIVEITKADAAKPTSAEPQVYNLVNPRTTRWSSLLQGVQARFGGSDACPAVALDEWLQKLRQLPTDDEEVVAQYPALKILPFFEAMNEKTASIALKLVTENSQKASSTFAGLSAVQPQWLATWMERWDL